MAASGVTSTISPSPARVGPPVRSPSQPRRPTHLVRAPRRVPTSSRAQGRLPLATLAGELAEAYPDCRTDFAQSFDQWEASIRDGLGATHQRGDLRRPADPDRLATALFAALFAAVHGGLLLTQGHRDTAPLEARTRHDARTHRVAHSPPMFGCDTTASATEDGRCHLRAHGPDVATSFGRSLHASSLRLVPKAANAPQGRTAQLLCGAIAGPLFASAFTAIGAARAGYDWERLPVSSLAIGRHGWLQRMNFVVAGVLYSCAGAGLRCSANRRAGPRAVPRSSPASVWA